MHAKGQEIIFLSGILRSTRGFAKLHEPDWRYRPYLNSSSTPDHPAMTQPGGTDTFYSAIPVFRGFDRLMEPSLYSPLPPDWTVGVADIVESTKAIAERRYKAVNMAGAGGIASGTKALGGDGISFVFGGECARLAGGPHRPPRAPPAPA